MKKPRFETTIRRCGTAFSITTRNKATGKEDVVDLSTLQGLFNPVSGRFTSKGRETMELASRLLCELHGIRHHHQRPAPQKAKVIGNRAAFVIMDKYGQGYTEDLSASQQARLERKPLRLPMGA